jgi:hypothetical protein
VVVIVVVAIGAGGAGWAATVPIVVVPRAGGISEPVAIPRPSHSRVVARGISIRWYLRYDATTMTIHVRVIVVRHVVVIAAVAIGR